MIPPHPRLQALLKKRKGRVRGTCVSGEGGGGGKVRGIRMLNNIASRASLGTHKKEEGRGKLSHLFSPYRFDHLQCVKTRHRAITT